MSQHHHFKTSSLYRHFQTSQDWSPLPCGVCKSEKMDKYLFMLAFLSLSDWKYAVKRIKEPMLKQAIKTGDKR
jgi:hypothetical protein